VTTTTSASYSPSGLKNNTTYYWKVVAKNGFGVSNGPIWSFTTGGANSTGPGDTSISVLQPNGGESLASGSMHTITWEAPALAVKFRLSYSLNNGKTWKSIANDVKGTSYTWKVPKSKKSQTECLVRVIGLDSKGKKVGEDQSDSTFSIVVTK